MINIQVPTFDEFKSLKFDGYKIVKIKNKPDSKDYQKITHLLPGLPQGYCSGFYDIGKNKKPIEITRFYDGRQGKGLKKLKGYFITVLN